MTILPLPKDTIRILSASIVVLNPAAIVKELVENALDARATSILVKISSNTVDMIHVKDNGDGICPADFDALGRRAHTSKLKTFEELTHLGGTSLGFRGEALAAANSVGQVTVTTRTAKDPVGQCIMLKPQQGGVAEKQTVSTAVGTTVEITSLFAGIRVRHDQCIKEKKKILTEIKSLLHSYALSRPQVRFSFKVQGSPNAGWSYSPTTSSTVREVTLQAFGKEVATQCAPASTTEATTSPGDKLLEELTTVGIGRFKIQAFLPKPDADMKSICNKGSFLSIDSRPVASARGTFAKIMKEFKTRLKRCLTMEGEAKGPLINPFIQLDVRCPCGSYDVNVSLSKDEVIFADEKRVLTLAEKLFADVYAATESIADSRQTNDLDEKYTEYMEETIEGPSTRPEAISQGAFSLFLKGANCSNHAAQVGSSSSDAVNPTVSSSEKEPETSYDTFNTDPSVAANAYDVNTSWVVDMADPCTREDDLTQARKPPVPSVLDQLKQAAAATEVSAQSKVASDDERNQEREKEIHVEAADDRPAVVEEHQQPSARPRESQVKKKNRFIIAADAPPTRKGSRHNTVEANRSYLDIEAFPDEAPSSQVHGVPSACLQPQVSFDSQGSQLDFGPGPGFFGGHVLSPTPLEEQHLGLSNSPKFQRQRFDHETPPRISLPRLNPRVLLTPPLSNERTGRKNHNLPFKAPSLATKSGALARTREHGLHHVHRQTREAPFLSHPLSPGLEHLMSPSPGPRVSGHQAILALRTQAPPRSRSIPSFAALPNTLMSSPLLHGRQKIDNPGGSKLNPMVIDEAEESMGPKFDSGAVPRRGRSIPRNPTASTSTARSVSSDPHRDPRMFLIKRQRSIARDRTAQNTLRRVKSSLLPLETTPCDQQLHEVKQVVTVTKEFFKNTMRNMMAFDSYISSGICEPALPEDLSGAEAIQQQLQQIFGGWAEETTGRWFDLGLDFRGKWKGKSKA